MFDAQAKGGIQVLPFEVTGHKLQQYIQQKSARNSDAFNKYYTRRD